MSDSHGNTPAAWSAVAVALLGFLVGSIGLLLSPISYVVFWIGVVIVIAAGVVFVVMARMGYHSDSH